MTTLTTYSESLIINGERYDVILFPTTSYKGDSVYKEDAFEAFLLDEYHTYALFMRTYFVNCGSLTCTPELLMRLAVERAPKHVSYLHALWEAPIPEDDEE